MQKFIRKWKNKQILFYIGLVLCCIVSMFFVQHNQGLYERSIAKVLHTERIETKEVTDAYQNVDQLHIQQIVAEIKNGKEKGEKIHLQNEYSNSGAYDQPYNVGNELFVSIHEKRANDGRLNGEIQDVKRDQYILIIAWVFIFILLFVGKRQGLFAIVSLIINASILSFALDLYIRQPHISLVFISGVASILFTVVSLLLVNGLNEKTYAAIIGTVLATFLALLITYVVMLLTNEKGLRYEEMQFLTRPYRMVFMAGLFIGSLGAVMDVAITMSSSIFALYEKNNDISMKELKKSGLDIGRDIMGTMTNILFFAYISGTIPMLILYLKNASSLGFTLTMNLSLELARALAGGIGIVLAIPIGLYISIYFVYVKRRSL